MFKQFIVGAFLCALTPLGAGAQDSATILKGSELTESALVEALRPVDELPSGVRTRSIRLGPAEPAAAAKPRSQGVLITFETNSAELREDGRAALDVVARAFNNEKLASVNISIEGHADPRGNPEDNLRLSQARADSVRNYLIRIRGVSPDRLRSIGKGDRELLNPQIPAAPENRRVTFVATP